MKRGSQCHKRKRVRKLARSGTDRKISLEVMFLLHRLMQNSENFNIFLNDSIPDYMRSDDMASSPAAYFFTFHT